MNYIQGDITHKVNGGQEPHDQWAKLCTLKASLNMCKCTGSSNEYECTKTGKAHCNKDAVCDGKDQVKFGDLASLEAKLCTLKARHIVTKMRSVMGKIKLSLATWRV